MGSFLGAAFILLLPIFLDVTLPFWPTCSACRFSSATVSHIQITVFGALIMFFLMRRAARVGPLVADRQGEAGACGRSPALGMAFVS